MPGSVPRLKDVAERANVSLSAASRILRGQQDRFGAETCRRVEQAARELGWRRNLLVNGIQTGRTKMIGVVIPPFDSFWVNVLTGIHNALSTADYLPVTVWVGDASAVPDLGGHEDDEGLALLSRLLDRRVDGLILWPRFAVAYNDHFQDLMDRKIPVAVIDYQYSAACAADSIETDESQACQPVADRLLELGHRRIACVSTDEGPFHTWATRRRDQFEDALSHAPDITYEAFLIKEGPGNAVPAAMKMLSEWEPTAVFCVTDHQAAAVYQAAHKLNIRIPEELSVVGFADLDFAPLLSPPLTTVRQRPKEIGRQAARFVIDRLQGVIDDDKPTAVRIGAELIERESLAPPRS